MNKCAVLNSIGNFKEAYVTIGEAIKLLDGKLTPMMNATVDSELISDSRFIDKMHLLCACYLAKMNTIK